MAGRRELRTHDSGHYYCWNCLEVVWAEEDDIQEYYDEHIDPLVRESRGDSPREW